jgi:hypothetical protein
MRVAGYASNWRRELLMRRLDPTSKFEIAVDGVIWLAAVPVLEPSWRRAGRDAGSEFD